MRVGDTPHSHSAQIFYTLPTVPQGMSWTFEPVAGPFGFTEGPVFDGHGIVFSDMPNDTIRYFDPETGTTEVMYDDTNAANGLKLASGGELFACEMNGRRVSRYANGSASVVCETYTGSRFNSPNDLAIDDRGVIWFTDPFYDTPWEPADKRLELSHRSVYRVDPNRPSTLTRVTFDTTNPNGLLVTPDRTALYVAQSDYDGAQALRRYPIDPDGELGDVEVLYDFGDHRGIDGMCFTEDGSIVATAGSTDSGPGPSVYVFSPDGAVVETHPSPDPLPTNCCFGGPNLETLYLTGSDGYLYRAMTDRTGLLGTPDGGPVR